MKTSNLRHRGGAAVLAAAFLLCGPAALLLGAAPQAIAQERGASQLRMAEGQVVGKGGVLPDAVVYLKNTKTLSVSSYLTKEDGKFHFSQIASDTDYEIWAEQGGKRSKSKSISSFSNRKDFTFTLKIDD